MSECNHKLKINIFHNKISKTQKNKFEFGDFEREYKQLEGSPTPSLPLDGTAVHGADAHSTVYDEIKSFISTHLHFFALVLLLRIKGVELSLFGNDIIF